VKKAAAKGKTVSKKQLKKAVKKAKKKAVKKVVAKVEKKAAAKLLLVQVPKASQVILPQAQAQNYQAVQQMQKQTKIVAAI
jgi:hypothetical protein